MEDECHRWSSAESDALRKAIDNVAHIGTVLDYQIADLEQKIDLYHIPKVHDCHCIIAMKFDGNVRMKCFFARSLSHNLFR